MTMTSHRFKLVHVLLVYRFWKSFPL